MSGIVLSVDLASGDYRDAGLVLLHRDGPAIQSNSIRLEQHGLVGRPVPDRLAEFLVQLADAHGAELIIMDGPQGWKAPENGSAHSRACEALLATQGKTGPPGTCKPGGYLGFISFSIDLFDELERRGWPRLGSPGDRHVAAESFPTSAWRALGLPALPGKSKATAAVTHEYADLLAKGFGIRFDAHPTHDELQAAVSGLAGIAFLESRTDFELVGVAPFVLEGTWREGYILNPARAEAAKAPRTSRTRRSGSAIDRRVAESPSTAPYLLSPVSNGRPGEQAQIRKWWHEVHGARGCLVWEYYLGDCFVDAVWFPHAEMSGIEYAGLGAPAKFPLEGATVVLCEAKDRLNPELIGQALLYGALARRAGADVSSVVIFAERGPATFQAAAGDLGLEVVIVG